MKNLTIPRLLATTGAFAIIGAVFQCNPVQAIILTRTLYDFTGDTAAGEITIEDLDGGGVLFSANIIEPTINGNIIGIWFGLKDTSLLPSLSLENFTTNTGDNSFQLIKNTQNKCPSTNGNNLNGGGSPCSLGLLNTLVSLGTGASTGLVSSVSFQIDSITTADFNDAFGLRYQSTGGPEGSSKLCYYPGYIGTTSSTFDCSGGIPQGAVEQPPTNGGGSQGKGKKK